jgi:hypothetical protein
MPTPIKMLAIDLAKGSFLKLASDWSVFSFGADPSEIC